MKNRNSRVLIFDFFYGIVIFLLLVELIRSGGVTVNMDALVLTSAIGAALVVVYMVTKSRGITDIRIKSPGDYLSGKRGSIQRKHWSFLHFGHR